MPIQSGDLLKITVNQSLLGQTIQNVYWYVASTSGVETARIIDFLDEFNSVVLSDIASWQNAGLKYETVRGDIVNRPPYEFDFITSSLVGTQGGDPLPSYTSVSFKLMVKTRITKAGGKRIAGLGDTFQTGNTVISGLLDNLQVTANKMAQPLVINQGFADEYVFVPHVVKQLGTPENPQFLSQEIVGATFNKVISTQRTRLQGRGI